ncbi:MAG: SAM hydroxide adenosyltransferase [Verrucomicrobiota bacterium]
MPYLLVFTTLISSIRAAPRIYEGLLDGAPYTVATPEDWSGGKVFFIVNGWRPADAPHLAELDIEDPLVERLIAADWAVARTAFRENGVDHEAHTLALADLKDWIANELGPLETVVMEGESTAGTLMLRIAEQQPELADGVIALSAYINLEAIESTDYLEANPRMPAILMSNITEIEGPIAYLTSSLDAPVRPALRPVLRPGHVNLNWVERWEALQTLEAWLTVGSLPVVLDGTRSVPQRETGTERVDGELRNRVTATNPFYGNALLGFHPDELEESGFKPGYAFELRVKGQSFSVFYGQSYGDVEEGAWIAFPNADDQILLARNHKSAIETAGISEGDEVAIRPVDAE